MPATTIATQVRSQGQHEGGEHHRPAQARPPHQRTARADAAPQCAQAAALPGQDEQQRQRTGGAAPERDFERLRRLQVPRHHAGDAPQQRDQQHQQDGTGMAQLHAARS
jgi:hypothetical protein